MDLNRVFHILAATLASLLRLTVRTFQKKFKASTRRGSGVHPKAGDEDAATLYTTPLLKQDTSSAYRVHFEFKALAITHSPASTRLHSLTLPFTSNIGSHYFVIYSARFGSLSANRSPVRVRLAGSNHSLHIMCTSSSDRMSLIAILSPVHDDLKKLKTFTPESLPPYNPRLRTKSYAQILKHRLLPIGQCIIAHLDLVPQQDQGALELQLCRFIAAEYWPLPVNDSTHLRIQEMYRNALFKSHHHRTNNPPSERGP